MFIETYYLKRKIYITAKYVLHNKIFLHLTSIRIKTMTIIANVLFINFNNLNMNVLFYIMMRLQIYTF
jgi:hypothetical protein